MNDSQGQPDIRNCDCPGQIPNGMQLCCACFEYVFDITNGAKQCGVCNGAPPPPAPLQGSLYPAQRRSSFDSKKERKAFLVKYGGEKFERLIFKTKGLGFLFKHAYKYPKPCVLFNIGRLHGRSTVVIKLDEISLENIHYLIALFLNLRDSCDGFEDEKRLMKMLATERDKRYE